MISIYDFGIFPYALGDILTWSVKQMMKAINQGETHINLYICTDGVNIHQKNHISKDNWNSHAFDLFPAFYTNHMVKDLKIFEDRNTMLEHLPHNDSRDHLNKFHMTRDYATLNDIMFEQVCNHRDISEFHKVHGNIPYLQSPRGFFPGSLESRAYKVVALHLRARNIDNTLGPSENQRDANPKVWYPWLKEMANTRSDIKFAVLGKHHEKDPELLSIPNVVYPRNHGWGLAHELSLITNSPLFMGSFSGFAEMAILGKKPYILTNPDIRSYKNAGMEQIGDSIIWKQPFGLENQITISGPDNYDNIMNAFNSIMKP